MSGIAASASGSIGKNRAMRLTEGRSRTEQFMALKELYMKSGQGFVLVFSLTHLGSVNELGPLREQIVRIKNAKVSGIVSVGWE